MTLAIFCLITFIHQYLCQQSEVLRLECDSNEYCNDVKNFFRMTTVLERNDKESFVMPMRGDLKCADILFYGESGFEQMKFDFRACVY